MARTRHCRSTAGKSWRNFIFLDRKHPVESCEDVALKVWRTVWKQLVLIYSKPWFLPAPPIKTERKDLQECSSLMQQLRCMNPGRTMRWKFGKNNIKFKLYSGNQKTVKVWKYFCFFLLKNINSHIITSNDWFYYFPKVNVVLLMKMLSTYSDNQKTLE